MNVAIDVGGTFTDLVADDGVHAVALKVATTPHAPERGVASALDTLAARGIALADIDRIVHATTVATNALLGQVGLELPRVVFVTTSGFRDVIEIGRQNRSRVYDLFVQRPRALAAPHDRIGVRERMDFRGNVRVALEDIEVDRVVDDVRRREPGAIAVGFLHSYANAEHEQRVGAALERAIPGVPVTLSSDVNPEYREYERFSTTVVNAALLPIVRGYLERLRGLLDARGIRAPLFVMQSNGGLTSLDNAAARPIAVIESGPAGGTIAAAALARRTNARNVLAFDMGGTTAKAGTVVDGRVQVATEFEAAGTTHSGRALKGSGYPVRFPFVDLAEISAGGGTIAWVDDGGALRVGPLSAGADPGPACYGKSNDATVTDANVVLGRLHPEHLLGGTFPIDASRSRAAIEGLATRLGIGVEAAAAGIVAIVDAHMSKVLRIVTVERGLDPRDFSLVAFGGNGPLHACALSADIGVTRVIVPARPGVFSAEGLLGADLRVVRLHSLLRRSDELARDDTETSFAELERSARAELVEQGAANGAIAIARDVDARYAGQSFELQIPFAGDGDALAEAFHSAHETRYGYCARGDAVEIVNLRLTATSAPPCRPERSERNERSRRTGVSAALRLRASRFAQDDRGDAAPRAGNDRGDAARSDGAVRQVWVDGGYRAVPVHWRGSLEDGARVAGAALIEQYDTATFVAPGWTACLRGDVMELTR